MIYEIIEPAPYNPGPVTSSYSRLAHRASSTAAVRAAQ